jgi:hypothetical protein
MFPAHHAHGHGTAGLQLRHCTAADAERRVVSWLALDVLHILSTSSTRGPLHAVCPRGESRGDLRRASGSHVSVFAAVLLGVPLLFRTRCVFRIQRSLGSVNCCQ